MFARARAASDRATRGPGLRSSRPPSRSQAWTRTRAKCLPTTPPSTKPHPSRARLEGLKPIEVEGSIGSNDTTGDVPKPCPIPKKVVDNMKIKFVGSLCTAPFPLRVSARICDWGGQRWARCDA
eukprot:892695-Rhodomonas_salina.3